MKKNLISKNVHEIQSEQQQNHTRKIECVYEKFLKVNQT